MLRTLVLAAIVFCFPLALEAQQGRYLVVTQLICDLAQVMADAETLKTAEARVDRSRCKISGRAQPLAVESVAAGPITDKDGDVFYVVQVDREGKWFTLAWPGFNSNLPRNGV